MKALLSAGAQVAATRIVGAALGVMVTVVLGRALGPEGFGAYSYLLIVLTLLAVPVSNGWSTMLLRETAAAAEPEGWGRVRGMLARGTRLAAVYAAVAALLAVALAPEGPGAVLPGFAVGPLAWGAIALVLFFDQAASLRLAVLRGLDHPVWGQAPEVLLKPLVIVAVFTAASVFLPTLPGVTQALVALLIGSGLATLAGWLVLAWRLPPAFAASAPVDRTREWCGASAVLAGSAALVMVNAVVDTLLLGALGSIEEVGVYRVAVLAAMLSGFTYMAFNLIAAQRFSQLHARGDREELQVVAVAMARVAFLGTLPVPIVMALAGREIIELVFGAAFVGALLPMAPLLVAQSINAACGMSRTLLVMSGRESSTVGLSVAAVVINTVGCAILIPRFGALGAAVASAVATSFWNIALWRLARAASRVDSSVLDLRSSGA